MRSQVQRTVGEGGLGEKGVITQQSLVDRGLRKKQLDSASEVLGGSAVFVEVGACFGRLRGEGGEGSED